MTITVTNRTMALAAVALGLGVLLCVILNQHVVEAEVAYHVRSPDKRVEIRIPEEALLPEQDVLLIQWKREGEDFYTLTPEDVRLSGTVSVSFAVPANADGLITIPDILLHTDDGTKQPVDVRVRHHRDDGIAVLEVDTENFRKIEIR